MADLQITDIQEFTFTLAGQDRAGNPAPLNGAVNVVSSDDSVLTVATDDGTTFTAIAVGPLSSLVQIQGDVGGTPLKPFTVEILASAAIGAVVQPNAPVDTTPTP